MKRMIVNLSDGQYETLRQRAYQQHQPMTELVRQAIDQLLGSEHAELGRPGRPPSQKRSGE
jgi:hypothetical protein